MIETDSNRVLVIFDSRSGHTQRMAELVRDGALRVPGTEVRLRLTDDATADDIMWAEGIAVGSPTHLGLVSAKMKKFWDDLVPVLWGKIDGKIGCAFASSGGKGGGAELVCQSIATILINYGMLVFGVPEYSGPGQTLHYGAIAAGTPEEGAESEACRLLGRRLAEWTAYYVHGKAEAHPSNRNR